MKNALIFTFTYISLTFLFSGLEAQEATHWRGPMQNGIYEEENLLESWGNDGPEIIWSFEELGQGHSSPVVAGDFVYATSMIDETGYLFKLDKNGKLIYKKAYGPEFVESYYGTRGSPVVADDRIYLVSSYGKLHCLNESDGKIIWTVDMVNDYGGKTIQWGYNETPVVDGHAIYCTPGGKKHNVIALNRYNGKLIWSSRGKGELSAYCTPLLFEHKGRKILSTHTASHLLGIDANTGDLLWSHHHPNRHSVHANTPVYKDGGLFYFSGYGKGSGKLLLNEDGSKIRKAWENISMDSRMGGAVLVDGYIYGSGDRDREWKCIDWETGENTWTSSELAKGNIIYADGKLFLYSERGELALAEATPAKFNLLSKTRVQKGSEQHWAHIMINDGVLYLRHGNALVAYKVK